MGNEAERVDIDSAALRGNPGLLADEAASISLFGGARHIRMMGVGEEVFEAVTLLLASPRAGNPVVAIAPSIKSSGKLVKLALTAPAVMAFGCYVPEGAEADRIGEGLARDLGMRMTGGSARRLTEATGGDRSVMARELEKIALYLDAAPDRPREIDDAALDAVGADLGEGGINAAVDAAVEGRIADLSFELTRLEASGSSPIPLLRQLVRKLMSLAEMRAEVDGGAGAKAVIERHRIFFREQAAVAASLRRWPSARLAEAIARGRSAERAIMSSSTAGSVLAYQAITAIARTAARLN
jgi:DNA polymerase-3 subunit delta